MSKHYAIACIECEAEIWATIEDARNLGWKINVNDPPTKHDMTFGAVHATCPECRDDGLFASEGDE